MRVGDDTENTTAFALDCFGHALPVSTAVLFKGLQVSAIGTAGFFAFPVCGKNKATRQASGHLSNIKFPAGFQPRAKQKKFRLPLPFKRVTECSPYSCIKRKVRF
jgi:hypothetical protein